MVSRRDLCSHRDLQRRYPSTGRPSSSERLHAFIDSLWYAFAFSKNYSDSLITAEPAPIALGLPTPKQNWTFLVDTTVPENLRLPAFGKWLTSYFHHADIVGHDLDKWSWVLASPNRTPTFFNDMPLSIQCYGEDAATDLPFLFFFSKQILAAYRKAFFDPGVFPSMKRAFVCGDKTCAFGIPGL